MVLNVIFPLFQSYITPQQCADWCDNTDNCYGFAIVRGSWYMSPRCFLKSQLTYPPSPTNHQDVQIFYRFTGEFNI